MDLGNKTMTLMHLEEEKLVEERLPNVILPQK